RDRRLFPRGLRFRRQGIFVRALWCARRRRGKSWKPKQRLSLPPGFPHSLHEIAESDDRTRTRQRQVRQLFFSGLLVSDRTTRGISRITPGGRAIAAVAYCRRPGERGQVGEAASTVSATPCRRGRLSKYR